MKSAWTLMAAGTVVCLAGCGSGGGGGGTQLPTNVATPPSVATAPGAPAGTSGASGGLTGAGATFPYPLYGKWFDAYNKAQGVKINYQPIGSGGGISQLKAQTVDFGASDAPLNDADLKAMPSPVAQIPTVAGAVAVVYNLPGISNLKLTGDVLAGIFLGTIKTWNDPKIAAINPGTKLPTTAISVAHRSDGSGTTNLFTGYLKSVSPEWGTKVGAGKSVSWPVGMGGKGNDGVAGVVKGSPGGVGYVELAYALQNKLTFASIKNKDGQFVPPSVDGVSAAAASNAAAVAKDVRVPISNASGPTSYPICGFTYLLVYKQQKDAAKGQQLVGFLKWALHDGQAMAAPLQYAPLPPAVAKIDDGIVASIK